MQKSILYLHGFYQTIPEETDQYRALKGVAPDAEIAAPRYHPQGSVPETRIGEALRDFEAILRSVAPTRMHLVGFSFGGLLAALLAERNPELVENLLLLAPAIDNYARNYEPFPESEWIMPARFVDELSTYPSRPQVVHPTTVVHGTLDHDAQGCALWRIESWAAEQPALQVVVLEGVGHSMQPWISAGQRADGGSCSAVPSFGQLVERQLSGEGA